MPNIRSMFAKPARFQLRPRLPVVATALGIACLALSAPVAAKGLRTLYSFCSQADCADGTLPSGLVEDQSGNFYGVTNIGGTANDGVVFELSRSGKGRYAHRTIYDFCSAAGCADGSRPNASLIIDMDGHLYGTTNEGGAQGLGEAYELARKEGVWRLEVLYSFCALANCTDGSLPSAGLAYAGQVSGAAYDGLSPLFGTTTAGGATKFGGTAYELLSDKRHMTEHVLHDFCDLEICNDGSSPPAPLIEDASGNLYGTTAVGGSIGAGTAFELSPARSGWNETMLYTFCSVEGVADCASGSSPQGGLAMNAQGELFGFANTGGVSCTDRDHTGGCGVVYRIVPNGTVSQYTALYALGMSGSADGANPSGTPALDAKGAIIGTAVFGGANRSGTVFDLAASQLKVLYAFCAQLNCADGAEPSGLLRDFSGRLFGTAEVGGKGADAGGTAFELAR
jgi:hypothetical protein